MNNLNSVLIEGNLTKDPQITETTASVVCKFSIATNRYYKVNQEQQEEVSYFDIEVWAKLAERCQEYLKKGRGVRVVGRLKQDRWTDQAEQKHYRIKIVAEHVEFKPRGVGNGEQNSTYARRSSSDKRDAASKKKSSNVREQVPA